MLWKADLLTGMPSARFSSFLPRFAKSFTRPMLSKAWTAPIAVWMPREAYFPALPLWWRHCIWQLLRHQKNGLRLFEIGVVSMENWVSCTTADCPNNRKQACQKSWKIRIFLTCLHLVTIVSVRPDSWKYFCSAFKSYHRKPIYRDFFTPSKKRLYSPFFLLFIFIQYFIS